MPQATAKPQAAAAAIKSDTIKRIPPRGVLYAVEGWGKTTVAAYAPKPLILMNDGETGYETLLSNDLVPNVDRAGPIESWPQLMATLDYIRNNDTGHHSLWFDALGGFESLCHQHVCERDFGGDWSSKGFLSFHKGYDIAISDWKQLLKKLEQIHREKQMAIWFLSHVQIKAFKNPIDEDYDRYVANVHGKTWQPTHAWADVVLFGKYEEALETSSDGRTKAKGGQYRVIYTQRRDAWDAKNRYGMPESIDVPNDPAQSYKVISQALRGS